MLDMIFSEWLVRIFLLYLLVGGVTVFLRRARSVAPLHFALAFLPVFAEKWGCRWATYNFFRARLSEDDIIRARGGERSCFSVWKNSGGTGLRYI